jgi:hypothetical protein
MELLLQRLFCRASEIGLASALADEHRPLAGAAIAKRKSMLLVSPDHSFGLRLEEPGKDDCSSS